MNYRSDIQVLRGIAVLFVVLFHLGLSHLKSGFLGVDIFFVISGFLMAVLYQSDDKVGFITRRAKRLLPAYYVTIIATLILSFLFTTPNETAQVISQAKFATFFSSNIGFWAQNSYFSKAEFNPLLHLWSLGVEIQFYLFVPLIFWILNKHKLFYALILITSMILCFIIVTKSPKTSFFMMPFRLWEFLIGYGVACYMTTNGGLKFDSYRWLGFLSLVFLCAIPFLNVDGNSLNPINGHPGLFSLIVSMATAAVLAFGLPNKLTRFSAMRVLEKIGKYSYSVYLAHFPIIVIYLSDPFGGTNLTPPSAINFIILLSIIIVTSYMLYTFVESKRLNFSIKSLIASSTIAIVSLAIVLPMVQKTWYEDEELYIFQAFFDRAPYRCGKLIRVLDPAAISCDLTKGVIEPKQKIMLVGNSHADSIKTVFKAQAINYQSKLFFMVPNNPLMKGGLSAQAIVNEALNKGIDKLVLHFLSDSIPNETVAEIIDIAKNYNLRVFFIEPVPVWSVHIPQSMYSKADIEIKNRTIYQQENAEQLEFVRSINSNIFTVLPVVDIFCKPDCQYSSTEGKPLYFDRHHLSLTGSLLMNDIFTEIILSSSLE